LTIDPDALALFLIGAALVGAAGLLMRRLGRVQDVLEEHGYKLVRIETRLQLCDMANDAERRYRKFQRDVNEKGDDND